MGKMWGSLSYIRNVVYVRLSPYEINPFANFFQKSFTGLKRDVTNNVPYALPRKWTVLTEHIWLICMVLFHSSWICSQLF